MQVTVEKTEGLNKHLAITVPAEKIDSKVEERVKEASKTIRLDGFRPGKVPVKLVKQRFGDQIRQEVVGRELESYIQEAIEKEALKTAGVVDINIDQNKAGEDFVFKATVETFPEIEVKGLESIKVEKIVANVEEKDVDDMIGTLQKQQAEWVEVDRASQNDDQVTINFEGYIDGEKFEGGSSENFDLILGSGQMIDGFESGLVGLKKGDKKDLEVTFPKDYQKEELAGKPAVFKIDMLAVKEPKLGELNDEFAKKFNVDSIEKLKEEIRGNMERELEYNLKNKVKTQVMDGLLEQNEIDVPSSLVAQESRVMKHQFAQRAGMDKGDQWKSLPDDLFADQAKRRVALGLLVSKLIEDFEIKATDEKVKEAITKMASVYEDPAEAEQHFFSDQNRLNEVEQGVIEDLVVEAILGKAQVNEKKMNFKEAMEPPKPVEKKEKKKPSTQPKTEKGE